MSKPNDYFSLGGANTLARRIREFWRNLGRSVNVYVEPMSIHDAAQTLYIVRSDMRNGVPRSA